VSEIKPYWVKPFPDASPHLVYGTGPCQMMIAIVCNIDWAKKIRNMLNEHEALERQLAEARKENEQLREASVDFHRRLDSVLLQLAESRVQIEEMKSCMNCKHEMACLVDGEDFCAGSPDGKLNGWIFKGGKR